VHCYQSRFTFIYILFAILAEVRGVLIPHGQTHTIHMQVTQPISQITFGFCSNYYDIG